MKRRYIGGAEEGLLLELFEGLPKRRANEVCEGCGNVRFLPCFQCNGSCKMVMVVKEEMGQKQEGTSMVVRCPDCNENGLVLCQFVVDKGYSIKSCFELSLSFIYHSKVYDFLIMSFC